MANRIQLKRSNTPAATPTTVQLAPGEMAINTHDGAMFFKVDPGSGEVIINPMGPVDFVFYVSKSGQDDFDGLTLATSFLTIKAAVTAANAITVADAAARVTIFVKSGNYIEDNPIALAPRVTIIGDNLRAVSVRPANNTLDIFHVNVGCYLAGMTFRDHIAPAAAIAFPTSGALINVTTSPYIQNCSSITTTGTGMRIDGSRCVATSLRSMVLDGYTQFNQGGIGINIINRGYAQLVSIFTICTTYGVLVESGGYCSITNSNSSFGTYGLYATGKSDLLYTAQTDSPGTTQRGPEFFIDNLSRAVKPAVNDAVSFDGGVTLFTIYESEDVGGGRYRIVLPDSLVSAIPDDRNCLFYQRSAINASSHTFEYVGSGDTIPACLPENGGTPIEANEVVQLLGGEVVYTSTDQKGNFKIGDNLTINGVQGVIEGETFDRSLFAILTPYVLAIEG